MHAPTRAPRPKSSYFWLVLPAIALVFGARATFDTGSGDINAGPQTITVDATARGGQRVTFENVIPDTIDTCSDSGFPNTRTTCFTAKEILDRDHGDTNWPLMLAAIAVGVVGLLGFAQMLPGQTKAAGPTTNFDGSRSSGGMSGGQDIHKRLAVLPLLMQDSLPSATADACSGMVDCHPYVVTGIALVFVVATIAILRYKPKGPK